MNPTLSLISWNVNGIRAAERKGFLKWMDEDKYDIVCVQEIKATTAQLDEEILHPKGYHSYWNPAQKPGKNLIIAPNRVLSLFCCLQIMLRNFLRIHPSRSASGLSTSLNLK